MSILVDREAVKLLEEGFIKISVHKCDWVDLTAAVGVSIFLQEKGVVRALSGFLIAACIIQKLWGMHVKEHIIGDKSERTFYALKKVDRFISAGESYQVGEKSLDLNDLKRMRVLLADKLIKSIEKKKSVIVSHSLLNSAKDVIGIIPKVAGEIGSSILNAVSGFSTRVFGTSESNVLSEAAQRCDDLSNMGHKYPVLDKVASSFSSIDRKIPSNIYWSDFLSVGMISYFIFSERVSVWKVLGMVITGVVGFVLREGYETSQQELLFNRYIRSEHKMMKNLSLIEKMKKYDLKFTLMQKESCALREEYLHAAEEVLNWVKS